MRDAELGPFQGGTAYQIVNMLCASGMTQKSISVVTGIHRVTLSKIATGKYSGEQSLPRLYKLYEMAVASQKRERL